MLQRHAILQEQGVEKFFTDDITADDTDRPELLRMLNFVREDDIVIVERFSQLALPLLDLLEVIQELQQKKVILISLQEQLDTSTSRGHIVVNAIASLLQLEREQTSEFE